MRFFNWIKSFFVAAPKPDWHNEIILVLPRDDKISKDLTIEDLESDEITISSVNPGIYTGWLYWKIYWENRKIGYVHIDMFSTEGSKCAYVCFRDRFSTHEITSYTDTNILRIAKRGIAEIAEIIFEIEEEEARDKQRTEPTGKSTKPTVSTAAPVARTAEPRFSTGRTEPTVSTTASTDSATEPAVSTAEPTDSATEPTDNSTEPTDSATEPVVSTVEPTDSSTEPTNNR